MASVSQPGISKFALSQGVVNRSDVRRQKRFIGIPEAVGRGFVFGLGGLEKCNRFGLTMKRSSHAGRHAAGDTARAPRQTGDCEIWGCRGWSAAATSARISTRGEPMKKLSLMTVVLVHGLAGCSNIGGSKLPQAATPEVKVDAAGNISVGPPVLVFLPDQKNVLIVWRFPKESKLKFAERGISIDYELTDKVLPNANRSNAVKPGNSDAAAIDREQTEIVDCKPSTDNLEYTCLNKHTRPGIFKYSIRLLDGSALRMIDPPIVNW